MTLAQLQQEIRLYLYLDNNVETNELLRQFINDAIRDFSRMYDWKFLINNESITLDGSNSYSLSTILDGSFEREIGLFMEYSSSSTENVGKYTKYNYENYIRLTNRTYCYAISGVTLYVTGSSGTLIFTYIDKGNSDYYPMTDTTDEVNATIYYPDIIKKLAIMSYLEYIESEESLQKEEKVLQRKILLLKSSEKRGEHSGKFNTIRRTGRGHA